MLQNVILMILRKRVSVGVHGYLLPGRLNGCEVLYMNYRYQHSEACDSCFALRFSGTCVY